MDFVIVRSRRRNFLHLLTRPKDRQAGELRVLGGEKKVAIPATSGDLGREWRGVILHTLNDFYAPRNTPGPEFQRGPISGASAAPFTRRFSDSVIDSDANKFNLLEFGSVLDAVNCAVEIQRELAGRNGELAPARLKFRIGINVGDIVEEEERIYGDGVNITARVESPTEGYSW